MVPVQFCRSCVYWTGSILGHLSPVLLQPQDIPKRVHKRDWDSPGHDRAGHHFCFMPSCNAWRTLHGYTTWVILLLWFRVWWCAEHCDIGDQCCLCAGSHFHAWLLCCWHLHWNLQDVTVFSTASEWSSQYRRAEFEQQGDELFQAGSYYDCCVCCLQPSTSCELETMLCICYLPQWTAVEHSDEFCEWSTIVVMCFGHTSTKGMLRTVQIWLDLFLLNPWIV